MPIPSSSRSTIIVPLRLAIEKELAETAQFLKQFSDVLKDHNALVIHREDFPRGLEESRRVALERLQEAVEELKKGGPQIVTRPQTIDPYDPNTGLPIQISRAKLDGVVIRALLAIDSGEEDSAIERIWPAPFDVIIDVNLSFQPRPQERDLGIDMRVIAQRRIKQYIEQAKTSEQVGDADQDVDERLTQLTSQYVFARLEGKVIKRLVELDQEMAKTQAQEEVQQIRLQETHSTESKRLGQAPLEIEEAAITHTEKFVDKFRTIQRIWPDFKIRSCITKSIGTVKVDAAHRSFAALGQEITWAVLDSGIQAEHPHFRLHGNIDPASPYHADFTDTPPRGNPLVDLFGHGTHVAGIIAGEQAIEKQSNPKEMIAAWSESELAEPKSVSLDSISGMAPKCRLVSLRVLDRFGRGTVKNIIAALAFVHQLNLHGQRLIVHGVNISAGCAFDPDWFTSGQSPVCVEVDRLVRSGVVVVVGAGNTDDSIHGGRSWINDPGNAELAITVGSTRPENPFEHGVSFFSARGPTGDGRRKPDLVAPGEGIMSSASHMSRLVVKEVGLHYCNYIEQSGTSIAAGHVSGIAAALLSVKRELIGQPQAVKKNLVATATDLGREPNAQGSGLVDLMRALTTDFRIHGFEDQKATPGPAPNEKTDEFRRLITARPIDTPDEKLVFVISAYVPELEAIFEGIEAAARAVKLIAKRVKDIEGDYRITDKIVELIRSARLIVADLSYERPNVYFELGYARGLGKTVITIAKKNSTIHFDVKDWKYLEYNDSRDLERDLKKRFKYEIAPERQAGM